MAYAIEEGPNFLVEDPVWAEDFAPNGALVKFHVSIYEYYHRVNVSLLHEGRLLQLGEIITRKRYAE